MVEEEEKSLLGKKGKTREKNKKGSSRIPSLLLGQCNFTLPQKGYICQQLSLFISLEIMARLAKYDPELN